MTLRNAVEERLRAVEEAITSEPYEPEEAPWVYVDEASRILNKSPITLQRWRSNEYGPPHSYNGNRVVYRRADLLAWPLRELREKDVPEAPSSPINTSKSDWWKEGVK